MIFIMEFNSHSNNLIMFLKLFIIFVPSFHEKCHDLGIQLIPHLTWKLNMEIFYF